MYSSLHSRTRVCFTCWYLKCRWLIGMIMRVRMKVIMLKEIKYLREIRHIFTPHKRSMSWVYFPEIKMFWVNKLTFKSHYILFAWKAIFRTKKQCYRNIYFRQIIEWSCWLSIHLKIFFFSVVKLLEFRCWYELIKMHHIFQWSSWWNMSGYYIITIILVKHWIMRC